MTTRGFSDATKAGIAVLQRLGKISLGPEMCPWCKAGVASEFDHIEAKANGGANTAFNGMFICKRCNAKKRAMSVEDWQCYIQNEMGVADIALWLGCKDRAEYDLMIGRRLRKLIGWKASEPEPEPEVWKGSVRANPRKPINPVYVERWRGGYRVIPLGW